MGCKLAGINPCSFKSEFSPPRKSVPGDSFMWLYDADKQFPFCASQSLCFLEVLFQSQERTESIIGLITAHVNDTFPLIGFTVLNMI